LYNIIKMDADSSAEEINTVNIPSESPPQSTLETAIDTAATSMNTVSSNDMDELHTGIRQLCNTTSITSPINNYTTIGVHHVVEDVRMGEEEEATYGDRVAIVEETAAAVPLENIVKEDAFGTPVDISKDNQMDNDLDHCTEEGNDSEGKSEGNNHQGENNYSKDSSVGAEHAHESKEDKEENLGDNHEFGDPPQEDKVDPVSISDSTTSISTSTATVTDDDTDTDEKTNNVNAELDPVSCAGALGESSAQKIDTDELIDEPRQMGDNDNDDADADAKTNEKPDVSTFNDNDANVNEENNQISTKDRAEVEASLQNIDNGKFTEEPFQTTGDSLLSAWSMNNKHSNESLAATTSTTSQTQERLEPPTGDEPEPPITASNHSNDSQDSGLLRGWSCDEDEEETSVKKMIRKAGVAFTGGVLVVAGIPMIPMPTPGGVVVVGSGMALLATEFPAAQRVLDRSREGLANIVGEESDDDEEKKEKKKKIAKVADLLFEDEEENKKKNKGPNKFLKQMSDSIKKPSPRKKMFADNEEFHEMRDKTVNAAKGAKRNVKKFIRGTVLPLMERITTKSESSGSISSRSQRGEKKSDGTLRPRKS
jgi:hypothetical protein